MVVFSAALLRNEVWLARKKNPAWRHGQTCWIVAQGIWPKQTWPLRGGPADPFYDDRMEGAFFAALEVADWDAE